MIEYVHKPCGHVVAIFKGDKPIEAGAVMRSAEWLVNGSKPVLMINICGKCKQKFFIAPADIKPKIKE